MPNFHYLGKDGFPNADNVNVYDYSNQLDYSRYDYSQMSIQVCSVPWEQGEAHIGQRTLSGIGNVVYFGSAAKRDEWFDAIPDTECFRWETKFKELHSDLTLRVPLPFDIASNYNYVVVTYNLFANDDSPLQYETQNGVRKWFYFVREARFIAPNTTELVLLDDAWQTWIYSLNITNMVLERGHAPMFATPADAYLANPIANCSDLLSEDINFGELQRVTKTQATALNAGDMYAVICTSAMAWGTWGAKADDNWQTPVGSHYSYAGVPNMSLVALDAENLNAFLETVTSDAPQFKQTVQCVFFIAKKYINVADGFEFCGQTCYRVTGYSRVNMEIFSRTKSDWGYDAKYQQLAKLYTYPYSALEITDERGNTEIVRIEDTADVLSMDVAANLVFPYINLSATIKGIGGGKGVSVKFANMTEHTLNLSGRWYEHLREWDVPSFAVVLSASKEYDYSTHFDRIQANNDRSTNQSNINDLASNAQDVANADASAAKSNTQDLAHAEYLNNCSSRYSTHATWIVDNAQMVNEWITAARSNATGVEQAAINSVKAYFTSAANDYIAMAAAGGQSITTGAVSGLASGNPLGALAGASIASINIPFSSITYSATLSNNNEYTKGVLDANRDRYAHVYGGSFSATDYTRDSTYSKTVYTAPLPATDDEGFISSASSSASIEANHVANQQDINHKYKQYANQLKVAVGHTSYNVVKGGSAYTVDTASGQASEGEASFTGTAVRSYNTATTNATNTYKTQTSNSKRTYDNEGKRIQNGIDQAALRAPFVYGSVDSAELATTRPMALFVNIVTESDFAIQRAGDEFLRYGYYLDKQWDFDGNWNIGQYFTFWKLRDYWSTNQIPDRFADQLRFLLYGGITVWSSPDNIGKVSIYENGI